MSSPEDCPVAVEITKHIKALFRECHPEAARACEEGNDLGLAMYSTFRSGYIKGREEESRK